MHWKYTEIKRYCNRITDGSHHSPITHYEGKSYISVKDIKKNGIIDTINCKKISNEDFRELERNGCRPIPNSILLTKDGTIGRAAVVPASNEFVALSSLGIIEPDSEIFDSEFLRFSLISHPVVSSIKSTIEGSALTRITVEKINRIKLPIPPLSEQKKIVKFIQDILKTITKMYDGYKQEINLLEEYKISIISSAISGKIDIRESV